MIKNMVVEIPSISNERYKTNSKVYINIITNTIEIVNDEEGNLIGYTTIDVPTLITQYTPINNIETKTLIVRLTPFNRTTYILVDGQMVSNDDTKELFIYEEEKIIEALTEALNKQI